jgi:hypothetical protein
MLSLAANMIHACLYLHDLDSLHSFQQTGFSSLKLYIIYIEKLSECDCMCADHSLCLFYLLLNVVKCGQVFRAVRSIVNGFVAFFTACNRHRLSIYNHMVACLFRLTAILNSGRTAAVTGCKQLFLVPGSKPGVNEKV